MKNNIQVNEYFEKYVKDKDHARQVLKLSMLLFDKLNAFAHCFEEKDKQILYVGALLHDIGYSFENKVHNKDGRDFILNNNILDFSLTENIIIACIIRYHRGKLPKTTHQLFMGLDVDIQKKTALLAGICRLADGLDSAHLGLVDDIELTYDEDEIFLKIISGSEKIKKKIRVKDKKDLLEVYLQKDITIMV
ncbi:HD domain-containing protein [bacterium]|nr:HD domain-containing protein [bacterium]